MKSDDYLNINQGPLEDLLQFLYLMPVGVVKFDTDGAIAMANPAAVGLLLSLNSNDTLQNIYSSFSMIAPGVRQMVASFLAPAGKVIDQEWLRASAGGRALVISLTVNKIKENVYMAILTDVSKIAEQQEQLHADRQKFFAIFDHVRDYAIYTISLDGLIEEWNQSVERNSGWLASDVQGRSMSLFFPPEDPDRPHIESLLEEATRIHSIETEGWRLKRDGSLLWENTVITSLPDETGAVRGFVVVSRDITERRQQENEMKRLATIDPLTGVYNRRQGDVLLALEFIRRTRYGRSFAVLSLDIDNFKAFNDRFGHASGDAVLCAVVQICRHDLRPTDMIVRRGGEEFLIIMPETDVNAAMITAERLRGVIEATDAALPGGAKIQVTVSIGVALPSSDSPSELIDRSDVALYAAKTGGRNRVVLALQ